MHDPSGKLAFSPLKKAYNPEAEYELRQKVALLQREFAEIDVNHDQFVTREELFTYLDRKNRRQFDRDIANDMFEQMDKDRDGRVTINEFIKVYVKADEILRTKIEIARLTKETLKKEEEEYIVKAQKAVVNEGYAGTSARTMQNGIAHVNIKEAKLLPLPTLGANPNLYVEMYLDRQLVAKTKVIQNSPYGFRWEEKFAFEIRDPKSEIRLVLCDQGMLIGGNVLGQALIMVANLNDQEVRVGWENLISKDGQSVIGQLGLELQWVYSKAKYYQDLARKCQNDYLQADKDVREYEIMLERLHEPFEGMSVVHKTQDIQSKYPGLSQTDQQFAMGMSKIAHTLGRGESSETLWPRFTVAVAIIEAIIAVFIMFGRSSFFDILCSVVVLLYLKQGSLREVVSLRVIAFAIFLSVVFDVVSILIFWGQWSTDEIQGMEPDPALEGVVLIMTLISVVLKTILAALCYMLNIETSAPRGSVKRNIMRNLQYPNVVSV